MIILRKTNHNKEFSEFSITNRKLRQSLVTHLEALLREKNVEQKAQALLLIKSIIQIVFSSIVLFKTSSVEYAGCRDSRYCSLSRSDFVSKHLRRRRAANTPMQPHESHSNIDR